MICLFKGTATTEIYTLSLHDALPILGENLDDTEDQLLVREGRLDGVWNEGFKRRVRSLILGEPHHAEDRKSTRLNSSHANISYAVFCLKKKPIRLRFRGTPHLRHTYP